tara:strand:+ start:559 stop:792 length:234 start_codon:yes stop_codon:yes gene_type:complete
MNPPRADEDVKKIRKFFKQGGHLTMEKADTQNRTDWFDSVREKGYFGAMKYHRRGVSGVFDMTNFDNWVLDVMTRNN